MALQELDLDIQYRPGSSNARADALSRYPVPPLPEDCTKTQVPALVAMVDAPSLSAQSGETHCQETTLRGRQLEDPQLREIIHYLVDGELPAENRRARQLLLSQSDFTVQDGVLYRIERDKTFPLRVTATDCTWRSMKGCSQVI